MGKEAKEFKLRESIPMIISIIALLVSFSNFYFQYFKINHSLKLTASVNLDDWGGKKTVMRVKGVIVNDGNRTEILYSGQVKIGDKGEYLDGSKIGPFVLKPGEATCFATQDSMEFVVDNLGRWNAKKDSLFLETWMDFIAVAPNGGDSIKEYKLGTFCYYDPSDNFSLKTDSGSKIVWKYILR